MEVVTEGQTTSEHTNNYEISEQFSYFDGDLNVINDNGDDNDIKREKILERQAIFAEVVQKTEDPDKRNMQQKLFDKLKAAVANIEAVW